MRRGNNPEELMVELLPSIVSDDQSSTKKFVGFNLSADWTAEHENGIKGIDRYFVRNTTTHKIGGASDLDKHLFFTVAKTGEIAALYFRQEVYWINEETPNFLKSSPTEKQLRDYFNGKELSLIDELKTTKKTFPQTIVGAAWDEKSFGIIVRGKDLVEKLKKVYEAFKKNDIAIWLGGAGNNPFARDGLCIAIYSEIPEHVIQNWKRFYENRQALIKESIATGIEEKLKIAKKRFFALSPRWTKEFKAKSPSKYKVIYWLNPMEQDIYEAGWFTVEELEQWIENTGPVLKKDER